LSQRDAFGKAASPPELSGRLFMVILSGVEGRRGGYKKMPCLRQAGSVKPVKAPKF